MKGLRTLDMSVSDIVPSYVPPADSLAPTQAYKPAKIPPKGPTELTQADRHTAHLRKKRQQKLGKRAEESRMRVMAKFDPKIKEKLEKGKLMGALVESKNVTIVGQKKMGGNVSGKERRQALKEQGEQRQPRGGKRWKHDLTRTLAADRQPKKK